MAQCGRLVLPSSQCALVDTLSTRLRSPRRRPIAPANAAPQATSGDQYVDACAYMYVPCEVCGAHVYVSYEAVLRRTCMLIMLASRAAHRRGATHKWICIGRLQCDRPGEPTAAFRQHTGNAIAGNHTGTLSMYREASGS